MDNYNYPCGADDRHAPWNQQDVTECDKCGEQPEDELVESYDREAQRDLFKCEACAGQARCAKCSEWYDTGDMLDGVCVDCEEAAA